MMQSLANQSLKTQMERWCYPEDGEAEKSACSQYRKGLWAPEFRVPRAEPLCLLSPSPQSELIQDAKPTVST